MCMPYLVSVLYIVAGILASELVFKWSRFLVFIHGGITLKCKYSTLGILGLSGLVSTPAFNLWWARHRGN